MLHCPRPLRHATTLAVLPCLATSDTPNNDTANGDGPTVRSEATYTVLDDIKITYAEDLAHD
jgi:hypothetical protein